MAGHGENQLRNNYECYHCGKPEIRNTDVKYLTGNKRQERKR